MDSGESISEQHSPSLVDLLLVHMSSPMIHSIPPSDETCYPRSSRSGEAFEYQRPLFSSSHEPAAYGDQALNTEYSSYARPGGHKGEGEYGGSKPEYGGSGSDFGRKPNSGCGRRTEVEYGRKPDRSTDLAMVGESRTMEITKSPAMAMARMMMMIRKRGTTTKKYSGKDDDDEKSKMKEKKKDKKKDGNNSDDDEKKKKKDKNHHDDDDYDEKKKKKDHYDSDDDKKKKKKKDHYDSDDDKKKKKKKDHDDSDDDKKKKKKDKHHKGHREDDD